MNKWTAVWLALSGLLALAGCSSETMLCRNSWSRWSDGRGKIFAVIGAGEWGPECMIPAQDTTIAEAVFTPECRFVITAGGGGAAKIWNIQTGSVTALRRHKGGLTGAALSPNGKLLLTAGLDHKVIVWNWKTGDVVRELRGTHAEFSPDGKYIYAIDKIGRSRFGTLLKYRVEDGRAVVWEMNDPETKLSDEGWNKVWPVWLCKPYGKAKHSLYFNETKGNLLLCGAEYKRISTINMKKWIAEEFEEMVVPFRVVGFSEGAKLVALHGMKTGQTRIYDLRRGKAIMQLREPGAGMVTMSPDGSIALLVQGALGTLYDVQSGRVIARLMGHSHRITGAAFSGDSKKLVTISADNTGIIWSRRKKYSEQRDG